MEKLLIIDDERSILELLSTVFKKEGYDVKTSLSASMAMDLIDKEDFDLVISDIKLPDMSGMEILKKVKLKKPAIPFVMITAYGSIKQAVEALKVGALDYVLKPFDVEELKIVVAHGLEKRKLEEENIQLKKELEEKYKFENMVGKCRKMKEIYGLIEKIAGTESPVLVMGESGTGKEMAARAIHFLSRRRERPFVSINCGALPENLLESELFGHSKGSFTGAVAEKKGMFEVAQKGTLFLDEVGEMSPWTQVKLLRALQERKIRRVGGTEEINIDVRIIAATNQDLKELIEKGKFREDLYYRLNVISFRMPPLRERKPDMPLLISHFMQKHCQRMGRKMKRIPPETMSVFESYSWPGNVRELENVVERIVAIEERETITEESLPPDLFLTHEVSESKCILQPGFNLNEYLNKITRHFVKEAMASTGGNLKETASLLGVNYRSLRYLIEKYELKQKREAEAFIRKGPNIVNKVSKNVN